VKQAVQAALRDHPRLVILADSRRGLGDFPPVGFKMNASELARMAASECCDLESVRCQASGLSHRTGQPVFISLAERGIVGALPGHGAEHVPALPVRGPIDIVGAGDAVGANLAVALASGAELREAMQLAMAAASLVIHQLGTTGTASVPQIATLLGTA
jgi:bifunctional ADP-heptose synthase (sugar kinase/adenylyltransferase)